MWRARGIVSLHVLVVVRSWLSILGVILRGCTHCGKRFTDRWAESIARNLFDVKHRHVVLTIPEELRLVFHEDRTLLKVLMDCAIAAITYVMAWKLNYTAVPGIVVVLHIWEGYEVQSASALFGY